MEGETKQRIIQEYVPGKQVTLAHIIANPDEDIYKKLGLVVDKRESLGILTITPSEAAIIDRFSGSLVISGDVSSVESAIKNILKVLGDMLGFSSTKITRT